MFNSPLPPNLSASPNSSASQSLDPIPARYHSNSPSFQLVPLAEGALPISYPFSGPSPLSPTSPTARGGSAPPLPNDPGPSSLRLQQHRTSISSASTADPSSSKGSPASPFNLATTSTASSSSAPAPAKPPKPTFVLPPPPPPLSDPLDLLRRSRIGLLQLIGHGNIDARPSRQSTGTAPLKSGACTACRIAKNKCNQAEPCNRCASLQIECVYAAFAKRGRKRTMTPNQVLLQNCHADVEQALAILASSSPPHVVPPPLPPITNQQSRSHDHPPVHSHPPPPPPPHFFGPTPEEEESGSTKELKDVLENPLALLAHISSLKVGGDSTTDEESGKHFLPQQTSREAEPTVEGYFATGLYQLRSDADPAYDPVSLGIISEQTLARFVDFYFTSLHPFVFHLTPSIHTPRFLRDTSPFLTTALACICATFDPASQSTVPALFNHLQLINTRIWSEGLKSLEIVQAYMLLIHWTPIANNWGDDRRWGWLGTAIRIATEIKLHKTLNQTTYDFYRSVTPLSDDAFQRLSDDRIRSWRLISVSETALGVSTGRLGAISNLCSVWPGPPTPPHLTKDHPHYNTYAILELTKIYANGICLSNNVTDSEASTNFDIRGSFKSKWMHDLQQWRQTWIHANHYVRMIYSHNLTILLSISLRFRGPVAPILEECRVQAYETATLAVRWPDDSYKWGSNISVVVVAYAATLLLRIDATKPGPLSPVVIQLCAAVADKLLQAGASRPQTRTLATLHGTRIRTLLAASTAPTLPQPLPSSLLPSDLTSQPSLTHPDIHATFESLSAASTSEVQLYPPVFPGLDFPIHSNYPPPPPPPVNDFSPLSTSNPSATTTDGPVEQHVDSSEMTMTGITLKPDSDHLWSLPSSESHMLWDLFHDHRPDPPAATTSSAREPRKEGGGGGSLEVSTRSEGGANHQHPQQQQLSPSQLLVGDSRPSSRQGGHRKSLSSSSSREESGEGEGTSTSGISSGSSNTRGQVRDGDGDEMNDEEDAKEKKRKKKQKKKERGRNDDQTSATMTTSNPAEDWVHRNALETDWLNSEPGAWAW